jgi:hypothetical protein
MKNDLLEKELLEAYRVYGYEYDEEFYPMSIYRRGVKTEVKVDEVLMEMFVYWLDLVNASDFGNDEGLEGVLV